MPIMPQTYTINGAVFSAGQILNMSNTEALKLGSTVVCYAPSQITTNGVWQKQSPLDYSLPLFILQLMIIVSLTRGLVYILEPYKQPRIVSEILGGVLLGPSCLGGIELFSKYVFPLRSVMVLETMANIGLLYHLFLLGVELDISVVKNAGQQALIIAFVALLVPLAPTVCIILMLNLKIDITGLAGAILFWNVANTVTAFPVISRLLADLKLLNTTVGKMSITAAIINDIGSWILLFVAIIVTQNTYTIEQIRLELLYGFAFILFIVVVVHPAIIWMVSSTPEGESFNEFHICLILTGVMICGFITDAIGAHSVFGAFIFGLSIPSGPLGTALVEKLEDFVTALLLPLFFAVSGLKTNFKMFFEVGKFNMFLILSLSLVPCAATVGSTLLIGLLYDMEFYEALSMGLLMNTKGLIQVIILNIGLEQSIFYPSAFTAMIIFSVLVTSFTAPAVRAIYKPGRHFVSYKRRTIRRSKGDVELRILLCVHTPRNVPTMINLLEASHPTKKSPICIYALHLVELTGRASAMLIVHNTCKNGGPAINRTQAQSDHIINAFENYAQHTSNITVQFITAISPYSTMHQDICNIAEDKRVTLIIVPFHKQQTVDGGMDPTNPAIRTVNQNVFSNAPCSVGMLIDRGIGGSARVATGSITHQIALLFFGGPDDREALAYAWRMAEHPGVNLTVLHFMHGDEVGKPAVKPQPIDSKTLTVITDTQRQKQLDYDYISKFKQRTSSDETIMYKEMVSNNGEETVAGVRSIEADYDLYIVGRGESMTSPLTAGLTDWSECPELGAIGDLLASSDFSSTVSVLVVQQYVGQGLQGEGLGTPDSTGEPINHNPFNNQGHNHGQNKSTVFRNEFI